jgi:hypothetical protein
MSTNRHDYILIGARMDTSVCTEDFFESGDNDDFLSERKHKKGEIAYLYDGYSGKYFIVGIPLQVSHDYDGLKLFAFSLSDPQYVEYIRKVQNHVEEKFNEYVEPRLIVLSHYT